MVGITDAHTMPMTVPATATPKNTPTAMTTVGGIGATGKSGFGCRAHGTLFATDTDEAQEYGETDTTMSAVKKSGVLPIGGIKG